MGGTVDVVLVVDRSCSMKGAGQRGAALEIDAWAWHLQDRLGDRLAVVTFAEGAEVVAPLAEASAYDPDALVATWGSLPLQRSGRPSAGWAQAREILASSDAEERLVVWISDGWSGRPGTLPAPLSDVGDAAWEEGIHLVTVGYGAVLAGALQPGGRGVGFTPDLASWTEAFKASDPARPERVFAQLDQGMAR